MTTLSLRISIVKSNNIKTMLFNDTVEVHDAVSIIRERVPDAVHGQGKLQLKQHPLHDHHNFCCIIAADNEYGLFKPDEDPVKGRWLEQGKTLGYYHFKNGVSHGS